MATLVKTALFSNWRVRPVQHSCFATLRWRDVFLHRNIDLLRHRQSLRCVMSHCTSARYTPWEYNNIPINMNKTGGQGETFRAFCVLGLMIGLSCSANGAYVDCRTCHLDPLPDSGTPDYFEYFAEPRRQHPVGISYPQMQNPDYNRPLALDGDITFFDRNGNGIADADEIQLFGVARKVECSSCHREHGDGTPAVKAKGNKRSASSNTTSQYLRLANAYDALCMVCHRN